MIQRIVIAVLLLALLLAVGRCQHVATQAELSSQNVEALLQDSETKVKDAEGRVTTLKQSLVLQAKEFTQISNVKDAKYAVLQQAVRDAGKNTKAATVFTAVTKGTAAGRTDSVVVLAPNVVALDSVKTPARVAYYGKVSRPGIEAWVRADPDSIRFLSYRVYQDYTVAFADGKVQVKALNPSTEVEDVRSFELPPPPKPKRGFWFVAGSVITLIVLALH